MDYLALSFVRKADDIRELRDYLTSKVSDIHLIAKIEKAEAVDHIDAIIDAPGDWRSTTLARLRAVILSAGASIVEEVKWKKPPGRWASPYGRATGISASVRHSRARCG